jgi:uncharacterized membrane protein YeaQ/YmgE (transglycosylase-associated protein family)
MSILSFLLLLLIAAICGLLGQAVAGRGRGGILVAIILGFIGALLGTWLARAMGLPEILPVRVGGQTFPVLWSIIGSALFVTLLSLLQRRWV